MNKLKCECGHVNPEGTVLCEACGKPIEENQHLDGNREDRLLNMRYDGSARRSLTYNRSVVDKIWSFFSSVKVGIWLIVITLIASAVGTIFPQEIYIPADAPSRDPAVFYERRYGILGKIFYQLGFHNLYSSWWYMLLISLIGISLVICSLDRVVPLYKALKRQKPKRHEVFIRKQRFFSETAGANENSKQQFAEQLKKQRYRIREEDGHIVAEKGRFSRWGPYVNHIGLIIILLASILRLTPVMYKDAFVSVREGERIVLPGTDGEYYIKNEKFTVEQYSNDDVRFKDSIKKRGPMDKSYQTDAVIYKVKNDTVPGAEPELEEYRTGAIRMNQPLKFDGYALYQKNYQLNEFKDMSFKLHKQADETAIDTFTIDLTSANQAEYKLKDGYRVKVSNYWPDYYLDDKDKDGARPRSRTPYPRNPAFVFYVYAPGADKPEVSFAGVGQNIDPTGKNVYKLGIVDFNTRNVSGLTVRRDYTLPVYMAGAAIFMIGVIQGMYWQHRRVWIHPQNGKLLVAAHTNKNWFSLQRDLEKAMAGTGIHMVKDQLETDEGHGSEEDKDGH